MIPSTLFSSATTPKWGDSVSRCLGAGYRNQFCHHQGFLKAGYIGSSTQAIGFQYRRLGETGMYSIGDGMQEIHLIG